MLALERRNRILEELQDEKKVVVSELSKLYKVSEETIRRDLEKLEQEGFATKSYGGAVLNENVAFDMPLTIRSKKNVGAKQRVAELAAAQIHEGDHIVLDASSTDLYIAKSIKSKQHLTVVTNSIEIILELSEVPGWTVISTGGNLMEGYLALVGPQAESTLRSFYVDKAFISCKAIDFDHGIMDSMETFTSMKQAIIDSSTKSYLVVDHTKFNKTAFTRTGAIDCVDYIITDCKPEAEWIDFLEQRGVGLIYPENE